MLTMKDELPRVDWLRVLISAAGWGFLALVGAGIWATFRLLAELLPPVTF